MKKISKVFKAGFIGLLIVAAFYAVSWIVTCGIIKLITICFGWSFSWPVATGIWLMMCLAKHIFSSHTTYNNKK